jgi:hypothetical protein
MIITVLAVSAVVGGDCKADPGAKDPPASKEDVIPKQWLDKEISVEQAETENMVDGVAFGARSSRWKQLKASLQAGDELWTFCSALETCFEAHAARCGIALVCGGRVVNRLVTKMN